jgi:hypothetical protein
MPCLHLGGGRRSLFGQRREERTAIGGMQLARDETAGLQGVDEAGQVGSGPERTAARAPRLEQAIAKAQDAITVRRV